MKRFDLLDVYATIYLLDVYATIYVPTRLYSSHTERNGSTLASAPEAPRRRWPPRAILALFHRPKSC